MSRIPRHLRMGSKLSRLLGHLLARRNTILVKLKLYATPDLALVRATRRLTPLLMGDASALQILACARSAERLGGAMAEAGVFMGGSARLICEAKGDRPLHLFDIFESLEGRAGTGAADEARVRDHFGPIHGRLDQVRQLLSPYPGVRFHAGLFPDTAAAVADERFAFVHLDLDLAESTRKALDFFHSRLVPGGIIVGDDYEDAGVRGAFESHFAGRPDTCIVSSWGQIVAVKGAG